MSIYKILTLSRCNIALKNSLVYWSRGRTHLFLVCDVRERHTLPEFPTNYEPRLVEKDRYQKWEESKAFQPKASKSDLEAFSMILPPPNVTGTLHLGHAYTVTLQDILCRWKRMQGHPVLWVPGFDHAGIATQVVVEKKLQNEKNLSRHDLGRDKFIEEVQSWKEDKVLTIKKQLKKLGASVDWSREYFTMDEKQSIAVKEALIRLFEAGWLFRDEMFVNWCCHLQSAISDIEVVHKEISGPTKLNIPGYEHPVTFGVLHHFLHVSMDRKYEIPVATTRPETIPGDVAVAVHPNDERYKHLEGVKFLNFFSNQLIPLIFDEMVDPNFGTGAVKITPAHSQMDLEVALRHNLPIRPVITEDGRIHDTFEQRKLHGLKRFEARRFIVNYLSAKKLYLEEKPHTMTVPCCSRSGDVIELLMRPQWFLNLEHIGEDIVRALEKNEIEIEPASGKKLLIDWFTSNKRPWCISRQMWWGHRLPLYSSENTWVAAHSMEEAKEKLRQKFNVTESEMETKTIQQDADVLDTWFSSALLPFSIFGWPNNTEDLQKFYPLSLMETGNDIVGFWVARMLLLGLYLTEKLPFKKVILHGLLTDPQGRKMSKSRGNVIDPQHIIGGITLEDLQKELAKSHKTGYLSDEEFAIAAVGQKRLLPAGIMECGADALRLTLCSHDFRNSFIKFDWKECDKNRRFGHKMLQACKFAFKRAAKTRPPATDHPNSSLSFVETWIISRLANCVSGVNNGLSTYNFHHATSAIFQFFLQEFCDTFLEATKAMLVPPSARMPAEAEDWFEDYPQAITSLRLTLLFCLDVYLRLLAPFMPYLAEELYWHLFQKKVHQAAFPTEEEFSKFRNPSLDADFNHLMDIVKVMRRSCLVNRPYLTAPDYNFVVRTSKSEQLQDHVDLMQHLVRCTSLLVQNEFPESPYLLDPPVDDDTSVHLMITHEGFDWSAYESELILKRNKLQDTVEGWTKGHSDEKYKKSNTKRTQQRQERTIEKSNQEIEILSKYLDRMERWQKKKESFDQAD